jgi:hypothetical protein
MEINQYAVTASEMKDLSFLDIDQYVSAGVYQSQKVPVSLVKALMLSENIEQLNVVAAQALVAGSDLVSFKTYILDDADGGGRIIKVMAAGGVTNQFYQFAIDVTSGLFGIYDITTDVFTQTSGNTLILEISAAALDSLQSASALSLTTIYIVTDAPYKVALQAEASNKLGANGTIIDFTYSGTVFYDVTTNNYFNGTICDGQGNTWNGAIVASTVLGADCARNQFYQVTSNTLGDNCEDNTFMQNASSNTLLIGCKKNTFQQESQGNQLLDDCSFNTFGSEASANELAELCTHNTFAQRSTTNTLGNECSYNIFEQRAGGNVLGALCTHNTFGQSADSNTISGDGSYNTFEQGANTNYLRKYCSYNTFKQGANGFIFYDNLLNVTIEAGVSGGDYSDPVAYAFLYNKPYASTIFTDDVYNYHRWYDPANDRIVVTNLSTLVETYIGGSGGVYINDANDNVFYSGVETTTTLVGVCTNNIFHQGATNNSLTNDGYGNTFHQSAQNNIVGDSSNSNVFEIGASSNTLADSCSNNTFGQGATNNILDTNCIGNTFEQYANGFTFGAGLQNVTIEAGTTGQNYTSGGYAFMYGQNYPAKIFTDGTSNFHSYYDPANDRIVLTNLSTFLISYIGGSGGGDMFKSTYDINNNGIVDKAQSMVTQGRNSTGVTLYKGTIIYLNGATGQLPNFVKAQANTEATSAGTFGVVIADIANNSNGWVATIGLVENLDTRTIATNPFTDVTLAVGETIYLHPTIAGYVTNVKPSAPDHIVYIGKVVNVGPATQGAIVYRMQNGYELDEIHNVSASSPANKDGLFYNTSTSLWEARQTLTTDISGLKSPIVSVGNGTAVTGTTGITLCKTLSIPANSFVAGDAPELYVQTTKNLINGTQFIRVYWNTSASLVGAILIASTGAATAATLSQALIRHMGIEVAGGGGNGTQIVQPVSGINNPYVQSTSAIIPVAINWTSATGFIIVSIQNGSILDSSNCNLISLK